MSQYDLVSRDLEGIAACFNDYELEYYTKEIRRHVENGWYMREYVIVKNKKKTIGFKLRIVHFPDISFWPKRTMLGVEVFKLHISLDKETHDFMDEIYFDPTGEWKPGTKVADIGKGKKS